MKKKTVVIITIAILAFITTVTGIFIYPPLKATKEAVQYISEKYKIPENDLTVGDYQARAVYQAFLNGANVYPETCIVNTADGKSITVVREESHWADNYQLLDISYLAADYFSAVLDCDVDFVEFSDTYGSDSQKWSSRLVVQVKNDNTYWDENNISLLIKNFVNTSDNRLNLYIKESNLDSYYLKTHSQNIADKLPKRNFSIIYHDVDLEISPVVRIEKPEIFDFACYVVSNNPLIYPVTDDNHFKKFEYDNDY